MSKDKDASEVGNAHPVSFLKLDFRERRTGEMTVSAKEVLYMRAHLGRMRTRKRNGVYARRTFELGEARRSPLYKTHNVGTLCAAKR